MHFVKVRWDTFLPFHTMDEYFNSELCSLEQFFVDSSWRWALPEFLKKPLLLKFCVTNIFSILSDFLLLLKLKYICKKLSNFAKPQFFNVWIELPSAKYLFRFYLCCKITHFFLCLILLWEKIWENWEKIRNTKTKPVLLFPSFCWPKNFVFCVDFFFWWSAGSEYKRDEIRPPRLPHEVFTLLVLHFMSFEITYRNNASHKGTHKLK